MVEGICIGEAGRSGVTVGVCGDGGVVKRWGNCDVQAWMSWKCSGGDGKGALVKAVVDVIRW